MEVTVELVSLSLLNKLVKDPDEKVPVSREWLQQKQEQRHSSSPTDDESAPEEEKEIVVTVSKKARKAPPPPKAKSDEKMPPLKDKAKDNKMATRSVRLREKMTAASKKPAKKKVAREKKASPQEEEEEAKSVLYRALCSARETLQVEEVRTCESGECRLALLRENAELFSKSRLRELCRESGIAARGTVEEMRQQIANVALGSSSSSSSTLGRVVLPERRTMDEWADMPIFQVRAEMRALEWRKDAADCAAMREELFLAASCFGLHQRWKEAMGKKFADAQLEYLGLDCCAGTSKRNRTLYLGMLVQRFPIFAFQSVLTKTTGENGWENTGMWSPKVLLDTLERDAEMCTEYDELAKKYWRVMFGNVVEPPPPQLSLVLLQVQLREEDEEEIASSLHVHGYEIFRKQFPIESLLVKRLIKFGLNGEHNEMVFQYGASDDDEMNDGKRLQRSLTQFEDHERELAFVTDKIKEWFPRHRASDGVVLVSKPGCVAQAAHADYQYDELAHVDDDDGDDDEAMPLGLIVTLMDETYFDVWPRAIRYDDVKKYEHKQLVLNAGDVLVFRGDMFHAGAAFGKLNARLHFYLDKEGVERTKNVTFYADEKNGFYNLQRRN